MGIRDKKFIYFNSSEIFKNDIIWGALELNINVEIAKYVVDINDYEEKDIIRVLEELENYDVAMTQNFVAAIAEACFRVKKPYISWVYDSPQRGLYLKEALYETNYIFVFDKNAIERLKTFDIKHIYYLPLSANIAQTSMLDITDEDIEKYSSDISFVGSLYDKKYMDSFIEQMPVNVKNDMDSWFKSKFMKWGKGIRIYKDFPESVINYTLRTMNKAGMERYSMPDEYIVEILVGSFYLASKERYEIINTAASMYDTKLYTTKKELPGINAKICPRVNYEDEMYKVFFSSKINLNITYRGIETGIPQRIFDIMSVGGFVLSNYQEEIEELFEIGKDIQVYYDLEDLKEKINYYMSHENERVRIGINGYQKVKELYNYTRSIEIIIDTVERDMFDK